MNKKIILGIIISGIIFGSVGVYAGSNFYANGISVNAPTGSSLGSDATLQNSLDELYSIADKYDEINKKINSLKNDMLDEMYPVGSIYLSTSITTASDVAKKIGGTWEAYGSSDTYLRLGGNGSGGSNSVKLSANQIPTHTTGNQSANHTHSIPALSGSTSSAGSHQHYTVNTTTQGSDAWLNNTNVASAAISRQNNGSKAVQTYALQYSLYFAGTANSGLTSSNGAHTHTITTKASTTGANSGNHTHTYTNSNQQNVSVTPKYVQVYAFKRTA